MINFFKKNVVPGPNDASDERDIEVKEMMSEWYDATRDDAREPFAAHHSWRPIFFIFFFFLIIAVAGAATVYWIIEGNPLPFVGAGDEKADPLEVAVEAETSVDSGEIVHITVEYRNTSRARLIELDATVLYPDNFVFAGSSPYAPDNFDKNHWKLPSLAPLSSAKIEIHGQIFGVSQEVKSFQTAFLYKPTNFHTLFKQKSDVSVTIRKSALAITVDAPDNLLPLQEVSYIVRVKNISEALVPGVRVLVSYPKELKLLEDLKDVRDNEWNIGSLAPSEERTLLIRGNFSAKPAELKEFKAEVGIVRQGIFVLQNQAVHIAGVIDPSIRIDIDVPPANLPAHFGQIFKGSIYIVNISTLALDSGIVELRLYDPEETVLWNGISVGEGYSFEIISEASFLGEHERLIRIKGLKNVAPSDEPAIPFQIPLVAAPKNPGALEFALELTPAVSAESSDLSVPLTVSGSKYRLDILKK